MKRGAPQALARRLLSDARSVLRIYRSTELAGAFGARDLARIARDALSTPRRGGLAVVHAHALAEPSRPALVAGTARLSYGELDERVNRLTHALVALGIDAGDRVGLYLKNGHEFFELHLALSSLGAVGVHLGHRLKADEVVHILGDAGTKALFFDAELSDVVDEVFSRPSPPMPRVRAIATSPAAGYESYEAFLAAGRSEAPHPGRGEGWGGVMLYTSGTTGRGKGARREFASMGLSPVLSLLSRLPLRRDERHLVVCPLYHALPVIFAAPILALGGCLVVTKHFDAGAVLATIAEERITSSLVVPTMLSRLLALPAATRFHQDTSTLRWLMSGAAPLPAEVARGIEDWLGPILYNVYGATETGLVTLAGPGEHTARPGTIGRPLGDNELRLLGLDGTEVSTGEVGELYVKNGMLMDGYHGDPSATRAASRDGFFSVGDLASRDADGYYYLADRKTDLVISGGVNIYPWEIEQRLHAHPDVFEAAVVGVPDAEWGESLVAWVVPRLGAHPTAEALTEFVRAGLADYKRPRSVLFVDALPRSPTGKVLKRELRARWASEPAPANRSIP